MTSSLIARRAVAALFAATTLMLAACGGGDDNNTQGPAQWRVLNLNADLASVDVYTSTDKRFSAVDTDALTAYAGIDSGSYNVRVTNAGSPSAVMSATYSLTKDKHYTGIVWGRSGSVKFATLPEDDDNSSITTGNARLRVYSATTDAGTFDVHLTLAAEDLGDPDVPNVVPAALGGFREFTAGTYRLRVTGAGDINDVRLDVAEVTLEAQTHATLILTGSPGGVLLNGTLLKQQGSATALKNTQARLRTVAGVNANGTVAVQLDGSTFSGGLRSPTIGSYQRVTAGERLFNVLVNGSSVSSAPRTVAAGGDYTLLVHGTDSVTLIADDNRLAANGRFRMRLIHGAAGVDPLTLSVDYAALVNDITEGNASAFATSASNSSARLDVTSTSGVDPLFVDTDVNLQSFGVYTVFLLGGNTTPIGVLRKDR